MSKKTKLQKKLKKEGKIKGPSLEKASGGIAGLKGPKYGKEM